jgi:type II secretory pathway component GspD/PulD (secretin)
MFGGVKVTNRDRAVNKVPGLGSLPVVGNLFKTTNVNEQDQELIFFVTPKVLPS